MAIPHNSKCRYGERGAAAAKPKAQIILDAAKVSAASGGNSEPKQGQRSQSARGFCPRSTMRVPQPDIIEHFGNADAVPQPSERCLSRKAGIVRYCLIFTAGHRIVPCRFYMYPIVYHVLHDKSIFHRQIRNFYTCPGKFCRNGARAFLGGCFPLPGCKFNQRIKANPAKQKVPFPQRYCRSGTSSYIRMLICLRCGRRDFGGLPLH